MKNLFLTLFILINIHASTQELIPYRLDNKWGYADNSGKIIIEPTFDKVRRFSADGYAYVYQDNLCAVIDTKGNFIIPFKYTEIFNFSDGLAAACKGGEYYWLQGEIINGEWGFINEKGEEVIPFNYYRVESFVDGYAIVQKDKNWGMWGVIDKEGKQILPFKYNTYSFDMRPFPGLKWDESEKGKLLYRPSQDDEVWRQIDLKGKLTGKKVDDIHGFRSNGETNFTESKNGKYALLDSKRKPLSDYIYSRGIYFYSNNTFAKMSIDTDKKDSSDNFIQAYGIIDNKGKIILPCEYASINILNGYLTLENQEGKFALADSTGKIVTPWKDQNIEYLGEGIYKLRVDNQFIELFKLNGEKINTHKLTQSKYTFTDGLLGVADASYKWGFINKSGEVIINFKYDFVNLFKNGFAEVDMNRDQYKIPDDGYINSSGVEFFKNTPGLFTKYKKGQTYIVDEYERIIVDSLLYAKKLDDGRVLYKDRKSLYQIIDHSGKKYIQRKLVDLVPFEIYNSNPDLPSENYFIGFAKDSTFIYDENLNNTIAIKKDVDFKAFELLKQTGVLVIREKDGCYLVDIKGNPITQKYKSLSHVSETNFIAEMKDGRKGYINQNDIVLIPFAKTKMFVDNENVIIASTFSGKKLINVDFYDFNGKKLNSHKITHYKRETSLPGFYITESSSTKKLGYLYNGQSSNLIYDYIDVKTYSNVKYIIIKENSKYSLYNPRFEKLKGPYDELILENSFITFKENGAYGVLTTEKSNLIELLPAKYESIPRFEYQRKADIIAVKSNGKYIFVNRNGEKVIEQEFEDAKQFKRDFTRVKLNNKIGYINKDGSWLIDAKYDYLNSDRNEYFKTSFYGRLNGKPVFLNEKGENKLSNEVDSLDIDYIGDSDHFMVMNKDKKMGIYDFDGNQKTPIKYDEILSVFTETNDGEMMFFQARIGKKYAYLNKLGTELTDFIYDRVEFDDDTYITGWLGVIEVKQNGKYGLMDFTGKIVQPCEFDYFDWYYDYSEDIFHYPAKRKGKWGMIGEQGKLLIETKYDKIYYDEEVSEYFHKESQLMHYVVVSGGKKGIVDEKNNQVIPCLYKDIFYAYDCEHPSLELTIGNSHGIFTDDKIVLDPKYEVIYCEYGTDQLYYVCKNKKKYQFFNEKGELINKEFYDNFEWEGVNYIAIVQRNKQTYNLNFDGTETLVNE